MWDTPKRVIRCVALSLKAHVSWSLCLRIVFEWVPSWELPRFKTAKHAISRVCPSFFCKSCGASDSEYLFVFHVSWELLRFVIQHVSYFVIFWASRPGSLHSEMTCFLKLSTGKLNKCKKHEVFDMKILKFVPASIRSPKFIENWVLFRKHRILRNIIKTHLFS